MPSDGLFGPIFVPEPLRQALSGRAWLQAMLDAEAALATAEAGAGVIPTGAAEAIRATCDAGRFDLDALADDAGRVGNPAEPLARALIAAVGGEASRYVHFGATSQDVIDTASMLVAHRALGLVISELDAVAAASVSLADRHRTTVLAGRTLLQHAVPTTFGLKAAGWLVGVLEARGALVALRNRRLAVQLGGAAGTLGALGTSGPEVLRLFAEELGLAEPVLPWHTLRARIAELGAGLATAAGALAKIGVDVSLLSQTEVGEVSPGGSTGGRSSAMPHKQNPVGAILANASARRVQALAGVLSGSLVQEHERAIGSWHAEWQSSCEAIGLTGGAAAAIRDTLEGLVVHPDRMRRNLELTGGLIMTERLALVLGERIGRPEAHELLREVSRRVAESGRPLRSELLADARVREALSEEALDEALDPVGYLGSATVFVDRALELYRRELGVEAA